jgi:hypothetical protein
MRAPGTIAVVAGLVVATNAHSEVFSMQPWGHGSPGLSLSLPAGWTYVPE